jgi:DNA-binding MarR family transcriptional regulator
MSPQNSPARAPGAHDSDEASRLVAIAQEDYANRRRRDRIFRAGVFAEPAWDMLLDLYVQEHFGRAVSIQSLCVAAVVPPTTALRWIGRLVDRGLVLRTPSRHDNRVVHISLTADGRAGMEQYLRGRRSANGGGV